MYDTIYCIEYSYLVLDTIYFARSKFCPSEVGKTSMPIRASPNDTGVAFIQQGGQGGRGLGGRGKGAGRGNMPGSLGADAGGGGGPSNASTITGGPGGDTPKTNSRGESHCYNCRAMDHWAYECPLYQANSNNSSI